MSGKKSSADLIRVEDAVAWIGRNSNPMSKSLLGEKFMFGITDAAAAAVQGAGKDGLIRRGDAVRCIEEAIPELPPDELDAWRSGKWSTVRAMIRESVWYPEAVAPMGGTHPLSQRS